MAASEAAGADAAAEDLLELLHVAKDVEPHETVTAHGVARLLGRFGPAPGQTLQLLVE